MLKIALDKLDVNLKVKEEKLLMEPDCYKYSKKYYSKAYFEDFTYKAPFDGVKTYLPLGTTAGLLRTMLMKKCFSGARAAFFLPQTTKRRHESIQRVSQLDAYKSGKLIWRGVYSA